jgi:hypothetical protein
MYEFILTKTVMLVFILGLVSVLYYYYLDLQMRIAHDMADLEAQGIATMIDALINPNIEESSGKVYLESAISIGREEVPYSLVISENGVVIVRLEAYPYQGITGVSQFGLDMTRLTGTDEIDCNQKELKGNARITVEVAVRHEYFPEVQKLFKIVRLDLDASDSCGDHMVFEKGYEE